jgi:hypothetical protein
LQLRPTVSKQIASLALLGGALSAPSLAAQPADDDTEEQILVDDLKSQEDPTILVSKVWLEGEWNNDRHDSSNFELTLGGRMGWRISEDHDWAVQLEVPYKRISVGQPGNNPTESGLADIKLSVVTAVRLSTTWRAGGGLELRMPTGEEALSANIWRLQEFVAVAWDATPWLTFTPKLRYFHTLARQDGASPQRYLELYAPATFLLPDRWSLSPRYEVKWDFENNRVTHSGKLSIGKQLDHPKLGFGLSLKAPLDKQTNEYQVIFSVTNYF